MTENWKDDNCAAMKSHYAVYSVPEAVALWCGVEKDQINGRDEISIEQKVQFDTEYLERQSILFDLDILFKTIIQTVLRRNISH